MTGAPQGTKPLQCVVCGARFAKYENLACHRVSKHKTVRRQLGGGLLAPAAAAASNNGGGSGSGAARHQQRPPLQPPTLAPPLPPPVPTTPPETEVGDFGGEEAAVSRSPNGATPSPVAAAARHDSAAGTKSAPARDLPANEFEFNSRTCDEAIEAMEAAIKLTRRAKAYDGQARKKRKAADGSPAPTADGWDYSSLPAEVQQHYELMRDCDGQQPLLTKRKGCRAGRFNSYRLRMVQNFALECGGGGMSLADQEKFYDVLDAWDRTKPGMPVDAGHFHGLRDTIGSKNAFKDALRDDIDTAIEDEAWMKCTLVEGGEHFQVIFRPALELALEKMRAAKGVKLWSGESGPAPPTNLRESPMDGDAFRLCEQAVIEEEANDDCFVLGMHAFSDASRVSSSGGK